MAAVINYLQIVQELVQLIRRLAKSLAEQSGICFFPASAISHVTSSNKCFRTHVDSLVVWIHWQPGQGEFAVWQIPECCVGAEETSKPSKIKQGLLIGSLPWVFCASSSDMWNIFQNGFLKGLFFRYITY